ncbi:MAG: thioredoxin family protein [Flavobacteriales bacterium]|nr:thioredoxin family protein [Flavobacteriales bacterium]
MLKFKGLFTTLLFVFTLANAAFAQVYEPVSWSFSAGNIDPNHAELSFTAEIEEGWHVYALNLPSDEGPIATSFTFEESTHFSPEGEPEQGKYKTSFDPNFGMDLNYFDNRATFKQRIKRSTANKFDAEGYLTFMVCNDEMCLPPEDVDFQIPVAAATAPKQEKTTGDKSVSKNAVGNAELGTTTIQDEILLPVSWDISIEMESGTEAVILAKAEIDPGWYVYGATIDPDAGPIPTGFTFETKNGFTADTTIEETGLKQKFDPIFEMELDYYEGTAELRQRILKQNKKDMVLKGYLTYMTCDDSKCLPPEDVDFELNLAPAASGTTAALKEGGTEDASRSNWAIFFIAFLGGFAALLTPCVFPMIPLTVSFFTKQSKSRAAGIRNAIFYGLSIIVIYVILGVAVTAAFGASVLSELSTDPWFNLFFFVLLIVFAISFLGAFEISLPASWINKADAQADRGGFIGIFFMAFTLALVSFSCTGPIVGTLIVEAASKGGTAPVIGMLGFSLAIALPFALFAAFPGWLNTLPQSGGWLNSVKVTLGFLELALAFKFLSNADMVLQLGFLEREVFIAIWIVVFALLTLYLLGKLKLSHDSDLPYISVTRLMLATLTGVFTVYLIPGMWGAPLKLISAFPPPMHYSESPQGVGFMGGGGSGTDSGDSDTYFGPQGLFVYKDYDKAFAKAKEVNKPLMLDFTGHACVNCRKMEQQVWSDPEIKRKLAEDVILVSLYVDEKVKLPEEEQYTAELGGGRKKKIRSVGTKRCSMNPPITRTTEV